MTARSMVLAVHDSSQVGAARRAAVAEAERLGAAESESGKVALVVTELATNLARHAGGGELLLRSLTEPAALEIVAIDRGPGMASVEQALRDGYSTGGTNGVGLGAVQRVADRCEIFSAHGSGTAVLARLRLTAVRSGEVVVAGVSVPQPGEMVSGDAWSWHAGGHGWSVLVADGLGHGPDAATAAAEAVRIFQQRVTDSAADIMGAAHAAMRHTRGAAVAIAEVRPAEGTLTFTGVGNVGGTLLTAEGPRSLVSLPGIVGHECRKVQTFTYAWPRGSSLVLYSDGLQSRWSLDRYPTLRSRDPALLAAVLYRDFARGRDDVTVVASREVGPG
ncbi:MAG TPA: ATP-binding protein [Gemmatimonadales bacterium]|nr:ATP-binding protein [Gemmatimonadales bacterium]